MLLYHGTGTSDINKFILKNRKGSKLDFGKGVYFTSHFEQAKEWACNDKNNGNGKVYECDVDLSNLTTLQLDNPDNEDLYYILYLCRIGLEEIAPDAVEGFDDADVIYGYMLDGTVKEFEQYAELFNEGELSFEEFKNKTKLFEEINIKDQYCFKNNQAIDFLNDGFQRVHFIKKTGKKKYIITKTMNREEYYQYLFKNNNY